MNGPSAGAARLVGALRHDVTRDERVLDAILHTPREEFVPPAIRYAAYDDTALSIGEGQTISQPTIVAMMTAALRLGGDEHVLEIGTGSGYQAAVIARLCASLVTVEAVETLRLGATEVLRRLGVDNVEVLPAGDEIGAPERGPYDAIIVTAAAPSVPEALLAQLAPGGRMVIPVGPRDVQELTVITRTPDGGLARERLGPCRFVPLTGPYGYTSST